MKGSLGTINDEDVSIEINDMLGQVVYESKVMAMHGDINEQIKISNTNASRMYLLDIHSAVSNNVFHVVVEW